MNDLVDSCGWVEFYAEGANSAFFARPLEDVRRVIVPTICIHEVYKSVLRRRGEFAAFQAAAEMREGQVVDLTADLALRSARLSAELKISTADSIILATARERDAVIWTQDPHFKGLDGVRFVEKRSG